MSSKPDPDPDRKAARLPLRATALPLDPVTTSELLGKIRALLRALDGDGKSVPLREKAGAAFLIPGRAAEAATAAPALSLPEALRGRSIAALGMAPQNAVAAPDPAPAAMPPAAPPAPRRKIPRAALATAGFLVLGATGLVVAQGSGLLHRLGTPARHGQAHSPGGAEPVRPILRAAAPPARPAAIATRSAVPPPVAVPKEPDKNGSAAPARAPRQNAGTAAPSAAQARTAPPTAAPAALPAWETPRAAARPAHPARHHRYRRRRRSRAREHRRYRR